MPVKPGYFELKTVELKFEKMEVAKPTLSVLERIARSSDRIAVCCMVRLRELFSGATVTCSPFLATTQRSANLKGWRTTTASKLETQVIAAPSKLSG